MQCYIALHDGILYLTFAKSYFSRVQFLQNCSNYHYSNSLKTILPLKLGLNEKNGNAKWMTLA